MNMNELGYNEQYSALKLKYNALKERCANMIEIYNHLVNVVGPNLKSKYMMLIGQFEHRVYELKIEISKWQRKFTLKQKALNVGEKPDYAAIDAKLDEEFLEYQKVIQKHLEEIKAATLLQNAEPLTEEETTAVRAAYLDAVKKLHPDLNPELPEAAKNLWNQIQSAHDAKDWAGVKFLASLVDTVVSGEIDFKASDGMDALQTAIDKLNDKSVEIHNRTERLKSTSPYMHEEFLNNEVEVKKRQQQLQLQIHELEKIVNEYKELWNHGK